MKHHSCFAMTFRNQAPFASVLNVDGCKWTPCAICGLAIFQAGGVAEGKAQDSKRDLGPDAAATKSSLGDFLKC